MDTKVADAELPPSSMKTSAQHVALPTWQRKLRLPYAKILEGAEANSDCSFQLRSTSAESHVQRSRFHASPLAKHQAMNSLHFMRLAASQALGSRLRQQQRQGNDVTSSSSWMKPSPSVSICLSSSSKRSPERARSTYDVDPKRTPGTPREYCVADSAEPPRTSEGSASCCSTDRSSYAENGRARRATRTPSERERERERERVRETERQNTSQTNGIGSVLVAHTVVPA